MPKGTRYITGETVASTRVLTHRDDRSWFTECSECGRKVRLIQPSSCPCQPPNDVRLGIRDRQRTKPARILARYKISARKRGIDWNLTSNQFLDLLSDPCAYCGDPESHGVDRTDSDLGYSVENCVPCCKTCNLMKNSLSVEAFLAHIVKILAFSA